MLTKINIQNFKSVRSLAFDAKRVNVFIGEPNTGKSNVIEALAFFSTGVYKDAKAFKEIFRFRKTPDLFFDREVSKSINIEADSARFSLHFRPPKSFQGEIFRGKKLINKIDFSSGGLYPYLKIKDPDFSVAYYHFKLGVRTSEQIFGSLYPPYGSNLVALISSDHKLRRRVSDLFRAKGYRLQLDSIESELSMAKDVDDQYLIKYPYESVSQTLKRMVFFMAILETSKDSTLLLDEPEAHTFPFYTTYMAERIALDESNQFFLTTHNPYVLSSIVGKTPMKDLNVFVTVMDSFQTKLEPVPPEGLSRILDYGPDAFLNLDKLVEA